VGKLPLRGLVDFAYMAIEQVDIFLDDKEETRLRMVVDCCRSNEWFAPPASVALCTGNALARLELRPDDRLWHGGVPEGRLLPP